MSAYEQEIVDAYDAFETAALSQFSAPETWNLPEVLAFVRKIVQSMIADLPSDEADFFNYGCDRYVTLARGTPSVTKKSSA